MLVLTQKSDDKIHIGNDITVTILRVKGRLVKVGIEARRCPGASQPPVAAGALTQQDHVPGELPIPGNPNCRKPR